MNDSKETVIATCIRNGKQFTFTKTENGMYGIWHEPAPAEDGERYMGASWGDLFDTYEEAQQMYERLAGGKNE